MDQVIHKKEQIMQYLYMQICRIISVSAEAWKCFRCDLTFKEEDHAKLHEEISKHSVSSVKVITA